MRQVGMCYTHGSTSLFPGRSARVLLSDGHVEPAVSVRPCLKTHESNNSLNVCPVVEEEMDEDGTFLIELMRQDMDHTVSVYFHAFQAL